jgi:predicted nucleotidyltransferase
MGRIFRYSEIVNRQIPTAQDFADGKRDIWETMESCDDVIGAVVIGSIIHGTSNRRSDIDVVYYYHETPAVDAAMKGLRQRSLARNLDLSLIPVEAEMSTTHFHAINYSFTHHLKLMVEQGGLIKEDFTDKIALWQSQRDDLISYLSHKWRYFNKRLNKIDFMEVEDAKRLETIQKALELAPHISRKMLDLWDVEPCGDSKKEVIKTFGGLIPPAVADQIKLLSDMDAWYSAELDRQMKHPDALAYRQVLEELAAAVPMAYGFLRNSIMLMHENYGAKVAEQQLTFEADTLLSLKSGVTISDL